MHSRPDDGRGWADHAKSQAKACQEIATPSRWLGRRSSDGNDPMAKQSESGQGVARVEKSRHDPMPRQGKAARAKTKEFQDSLSASMGKIRAIDAELLSKNSALSSRHRWEKLEPSMPSSYPAPAAIASRHRWEKLEPSMPSSYQPAAVISSRHR